MLCIIGLGLIPFLDRENEGTGEWFGGPGGWKLVKWSVVVGFASSILVEAFAIRFGWLREWFSGYSATSHYIYQSRNRFTSIYAVYSIWAVRRQLDAGRSTRTFSFVSQRLYRADGYRVTYFLRFELGFLWSPSDWGGPLTLVNGNKYLLMVSSIGVFFSSPPPQCPKTLRKTGTISGQCQDHLGV
ncbi:MAG: hypothetical protein IPK98_05995 [Chloracidobacterium sp.]|nr:hypothetical protein [Chloracidobacterium sp.]